MKKTKLGEFEELVLPAVATPCKEKTVVKRSSAKAENKA